MPDITLTEALYCSYHNYIAAHCQSYPGRLKSMILVPGGDVDWAVKEVKRLRNAPWVAAVWPLLPEGKPIDHPDLAPLWDEMNGAYLPILFHSFFYEPPYFPGYRDIWDNAVVARTAAHPWGAAPSLLESDRWPKWSARSTTICHYDGPSARPAGRLLVPGIGTL